MGEEFIEGLDGLPIEELRKLKLIKLRSIRDFYLSKTDWITSFRLKENEAINLGIMTVAERRWTDLEFASYLLWCKTLLDLPETVSNNNYEILDSLDYNTGLSWLNNNLFPVCPLDKPLSFVEEIDS